MPDLHLLIPQPNHYYDNEHHKLLCNNLLHFPVQVDPLMMLFGMGGAGFNFGEKAHRLAAEQSFFFEAFPFFVFSHLHMHITALLLLLYFALPLSLCPQEMCFFKVLAMMV